MQCHIHQRIDDEYIEDDVSITLNQGGSCEQEIYEFVEKEINCTEINSIEELIEKINEINIEKNKLYKIILIGKRNFEINIYDLYKYELNEKIIKIKNKTKPNYNLEEISKENTLRGLFAKEILEEIKNKNYNEEIIENALEIGMEILE